MEETKLFYSQKAISIATFFGGPLAAGYLVKKNYETLGQADNARKSLFIGILSTIIIFGGLLLLPEEIFDKVPNALLPTLYTFVIYLIVEKLQGKELKLHKESDGKFYSGWNAALVGTISMIILLVVVVGSSVLMGISPKLDFDEVAYDKGIEIISVNENKAIAVYDRYESYPPDILVDKLKSTIVLWKENIDILNELNLIENLPIEYSEYNKILLKYSDLRIQLDEAVIKSVLADTDDYLPVINRLNREISEIVNQLSK